MTKRVIHIIDLTSERHRGLCGSYARWSYSVSNYKAGMRWYGGEASTPLEPCKKCAKSPKLQLLLLSESNL